MIKKVVNIKQYANVLSQIDGLRGGIDDAKNLYIVDNIIERNNIPYSSREEMMLCNVLDDGSGNEKTYILVDGITNDDWVDYSTFLLENKIIDGGEW